MVIGSAKIPRYVWRDGSGYASPRVLQTSFQIGSAVLYGFSGKPEYDAFLDSLRKKVPTVPVTHRLLIDKAGTRYREAEITQIEEASHASFTG